VVLSETPERSESLSPVAKYLQFLNQSGACKKAAQPDLTTCSGSRTENGRNINIVFFVVDSGKVMPPPSSGIPVHARCDETARGPLCRISEELENKVTVKASIDANSLSSEGIQKLRTELIDFARKRAIR
jgi:hypothetical protein